MAESNVPTSIFRRKLRNFSSQWINNSKLINVIDTRSIFRSLAPRQIPKALFRQCFERKKKKKKTLVREHGKIFTSHLWNPSYLTLIFFLKRMINSLLIKAPPKVIKPWWYNNYSPAEQPPLPAQQKMRNKISTRNSKGCGFINLWNNTVFDNTRGKNKN